MPTTGKRRIGVFVCHCGGNISDYVEVEKVIEVIKEEPGVMVARTHMFTCSDAAQQEIIDDIQESKLDGLVVASCSPKLHMFTFRAMAERAGLNPYQYVQVNMREQCSWAHTNNKMGATEKGIALVRAGIAKCANSKPLQALRVDTVPRAMVVGAGVAGLRAALALSDLGLTVYVVEKENEVGGAIPTRGHLFPDGKTGREIIDNLVRQLNERDNVIIYTGAQIVNKEGGIGNFTVRVRVSSKEVVTLNVGSIVVATGFASYEPLDGEYGFGHERVMRLPELRQLIQHGAEPLTVQGREIRSIAYIYCVGSRQEKSEACPNPNTYCSRYCCTAASSTALELDEDYEKNGKSIRQYHLFRDIRTYGRYEAIYEKARENGSIYLRFDPAEPPVVEVAGQDLTVKVKDQLTGGMEIEIPIDLVVLVTAMVPAENKALTDVLKLPYSLDGFYNEIHLKLRPVETVIDGVLISGTAQGPKTMSESVASAMAAVSKAGAMLMKGYIDLEPLVAFVDEDKCTWCGLCQKACLYNAIDKVTINGKDVAHVTDFLCKGGGACVTVCPNDAINVEGYTSTQIKAMIDASIREVAL